MQREWKFGRLMMLEMHKIEMQFEVFIQRLGGTIIVRDKKRLLLKNFSENYKKIASSRSK